MRRSIKWIGNLQITANSSSSHDFQNAVLECTRRDSNSYATWCFARHFKCLLSTNSSTDAKANIQSFQISYSTFTFATTNDGTLRSCTCTFRRRQTLKTFARLGIRRVLFFKDCYIIFNCLALADNQLTTLGLVSDTVFGPIYRIYHIH